MEELCTERERDKECDVSEVWGNLAEIWMIVLYQELFPEFKPLHTRAVSTSLIYIWTGTGPWLADNQSCDLNNELIGWFTRNCFQKLSRCTSAVSTSLRPSFCLFLLSISSLRVATIFPQFSPGSVSYLHDGIISISNRPNHWLADNQSRDLNKEFWLVPATCTYP